MSSILDALKKVEQNSRSSSASQHHRKTAADDVDHVRYPSSKATKGSWPGRMMMVLVVVVISLCTFIGYDLAIRKHSNQQASVPERAVQEDSVSTPSLPPEQGSVVISQARSPENVSEKPDKIVAPVARQPLKSPAVIENKLSEQEIAADPADGNERRNVSVAEIQPEKAVTETLAANSLAASPETPMNDLVDKAVIKKETAAPNEFPSKHETTAMAYSLPPEKFPLLEDGLLKLQAITWSPVAAKRFIVINNKISRTRDTINGYTITAINMDSIVVREQKSSKKWLVEFRTR